MQEMSLQCRLITVCVCDWKSSKLQWHTQSRQMHEHSHVKHAKDSMTSMLDGTALVQIVQACFVQHEQSSIAHLSIQCGTFARYHQQQWSLGRPSATEPPA